MFSCSYPSEALSPVCSWLTVVDKVTRWTENEWLPLNEHFTLEWRGLQRTFLLSPLFYYDFHTFIIVFIYALSFRKKMQFSERSKVEIATIITHVKKQFNWHSIQAIKYKDLIHVQLHMKKKSNTRQNNYLLNPLKWLKTHYQSWQFEVLETGQAYLKAFSLLKLFWFSGETFVKYCESCADCTFYTYMPTDWKEAAEEEICI